MTTTAKHTFPSIGSALPNTKHNTRKAENRPHIQNQWVCLCMGTVLPVFTLEIHKIGTALTRTHGSYQSIRMGWVQLPKGNYFQTGLWKKIQLCQVQEKTSTQTIHQGRKEWINTYWEMPKKQGPRSWYQRIEYQAREINETKQDYRSF